MLEDTCWVSSFLSFPEFSSIHKQQETSYLILCALVSLSEKKQTSLKEMSDNLRKWMYATLGVPGCGWRAVPGGSFLPSFLLFLVLVSDEVM